MEIYDENNNLVDTSKIEVKEQEQARRYLEKDDVVLELGARYGSVSCIVNNILENKKNQVVVEPDDRVWDALEKNKKINNCDFTILKGFISKKQLKLKYPACKYSTYSVIADYAEAKEDNSNIPCYSLPTLPFTVLIADCEGGLGQFIEENESILNNLRLIIMEKDNPSICDYQKLISIFTKYGFHCIEDGFNCVYKKIPNPSG